LRTPEDRPEKVVVGPNFLSSWFIYDYEICDGVRQLERVMDTINHHGYDLVSVTQDLTGVYTVFFKRRACG
jgi:hypothetical protein